MSFWPFGSVVTDSHIEQRINDYIHVFHAVEQSSFHGTDKRDHNSLAAIQSGPTEEDLTTDLDHLHINNHNARIDQKSIRSDRSSFSSLFHAGEHIELPPPLPYYNLSEEFIQEILRESNLLDELIKENTKLLDFICFGYFYREDSSDEKHFHIDYIIDKLLMDLDELHNIPLQFQVESEAISEPTEMQPGELQTIDEVDTFDLTQDTGISINGGTTEAQDMIPPHLNIRSEISLLSDILTLHNTLLNRVVVEDHTRMSKLWNIINHPDMVSVDLIHVRIFLKLQDAFLANRKNSYLNFIRSHSTLLDDFFHRDTFPALFEFLLRLLCTDKPNDPSGILDLVEEQHLIPRCIAYLEKNEVSDTAQITISDFLRQLIELSVNIPVNDISIGPNNLTRQLVSEPIVSKLIQILLEQKGKVLSHIVVLTIEIIRKNNSDFDPVNLMTSSSLEIQPSKRDPLYLGDLLNCYTEHLPQLLDIIWDAESAILPKEFDPSENVSIIGITRIKILELIAELLHCSNMETLNSNVAMEKELKRQNIRQSVSSELQDILGGKLTPDDDHPKEVEAVGSLPSKTLFGNHSGLSIEEIGTPYISEEGNTILRNQNTAGNRFKFALYDLEVIPRLLKIFLCHPSNNFWHNVIFDILQQLLNSSVANSYNPFLIYSLFCLEKSRKYQAIPSADQAEKKSDFNIIEDFILEGYRKSHEHYHEFSVTLGYSGHLLLIAEDMVTFATANITDNISPDISIALRNDSWMKLATSVIPMMKTMCTRILGGGECVEDDNGNITLQLHMGEGGAASVDSKEEMDKFNEMLSETCLTQNDVSNKIAALW